MSTSRRRHYRGIGIGVALAGLGLAAAEAAPAERSRPGAATGAPASDPRAWSSRPVFAPATAS